jgi:DNA repair exonuclease SbcCD ATPase subunit
VLDLPATGIVTLSGHNGGGKSALVEAAGLALWGETLRGASPWEADAEGVSVEAHVTVRGAELIVERSRSKGSPKLSLRANRKLPVFENNTKTQSFIDSLCGTFDLWARTAVFSSSDAHTFSASSDAERKRLIESLLCLDRLDVAQQHATKALRDVEYELVSAACALDVKRALCASSEGRWRKLEAEAKQVPERLVKACDIAAEHAAYYLKEFERAAELAAEEYRSVSASTAAVEGELSAAVRAQTALQRDVCPTCKRPFEQGHEESHAKRVSAEELEGLQRRVTQSRKAEASAREGIQRARAAVADAHRECLRCESDLREARFALTVKQRFDAAAEELLSAQAEVLAAEKEEKSAKEKAATLRFVREALGVRGARGRLLDDAVRALGAAASVWFQRFGAVGWKVHLKPTTERKSGSVVDVLSLEVTGPGGKTWRACSGGQRRRLDVSLLLALAELAAGARGTEPGTLFFDEVFDALDEDGVDAVSVVLEHLARTRCVVLVSHQKALLARVPATARYEVRSGTISTA